MAEPTAPCPELMQSGGIVDKEALCAAVIPDTTKYGIEVTNDIWGVKVLHSAVRFSASLYIC